MSDALTDFILKPAAPFAAGVVLFGVVWGVFKGVEEVVNDETKLDIWAWLAERKPLGPMLQSWPNTFTQVFDQVFGTRPFSWKRFYRSSIVSFLTASVVWGFYYITHFRGHHVTTTEFLVSPIYMFVFCSLPGYVSLLKTRYILGHMRANPWLRSVFILLDLLITVVLSLSLVFIEFLLARLQDKSVSTDWLIVAQLLTVPALFTSLCVWLFASSGFLLKAARRFDIGFQWFNRRFDIEKKPLSAIGLVVGSLVALLYWSWAIIRYFYPA
jgi:hypothetical protein